MFPGPYQPGFRVVADTGVNFTSWLRHLGQPNPTASGPPSFTDSGRGGDGSDNASPHAHRMESKHTIRGDRKFTTYSENPVIQESQPQKSENPDQSPMDSTDTSKKEEIGTDSDEWGPLPEGVGGDISDRNEPVWKKIEGNEVPAGSEVVIGLQSGEKYIRKPPISEEKQSQEDLDMKQGLNADLSEEAKKGAADSAKEASRKLEETMKQIEEIANCRAKSIPINPSTCPTKKSDYLKMLRNLAVDKAYNSTCKDHSGEKLEYFRETCPKPTSEEKVPITPSADGTTSSTPETKDPRTSAESKSSTKRGGTRKNKSKRRNLKKNTRRRR